MAITINTKGDIKLISPKNGTDFSLEELQGAVGGNIEIVHLLMVVNEEGVLEGLHSNLHASEIYGDLIVGDALICRADEVR